MKGNEIKFKTKTSKGEILEETTPIPNNTDPKEYIEKLLKDFNKEEDNRKKQRSSYNIDYRELVSVENYTGKKKQIYQQCVFTGKLNQVTISRDGMMYDIIKCENCHILFRRLTLENPQVECEPEKVCLKCNKIYRTEAGLKRHNKIDNHKIPDWYPDGV